MSDGNFPSLKEVEGMHWIFQDAREPIVILLSVRAQEVILAFSSVCSLQRGKTNINDEPSNKAGQTSIGINKKSEIKAKQFFITT